MRESPLSVLVLFKTHNENDFLLKTTPISKSGNQVN